MKEMSSYTSLNGSNERKRYRQSYTRKSSIAVPLAFLGSTLALGMVQGPTFTDQEPERNETVERAWMRSSVQVLNQSSSKVSSSGSFLRYKNGMDVLKTIRAEYEPYLDGVPTDQFEKEFSKVMKVMASIGARNHIEFDRQDECVFIYAATEVKKYFFNFFFEDGNIEGLLNIFSAESSKSYDGNVFDCIEKLLDDVRRV